MCFIAISITITIASFSNPGNLIDPKLMIATISRILIHITRNILIANIDAMIVTVTTICSAIMIIIVLVPSLASLWFRV